MKTIFFSISTLLFVLAAVCFLSSCMSETAQSVPAVKDSVVQVIPPAPKPICHNPFIVGIDVDQSGSMKWSGTPPLSTKDFKPLLDRISHCGGELGVTFVRADSAKPIERIRVDEPPPLPAEPVQNPDEEDYEFQDRLDEYRQKLTVRDEAINRRLEKLQPELENYINGLAPLLAHMPKGSTDFRSSVNRLFVFMREGDAVWRVKPHRYLIIVSDAQDTVGKSKNDYKVDASIFWVNGNSSDKFMKDFPFKRFENFAMAVAEIIAIEGGK